MMAAHTGSLRKPGKANKIMAEPSSSISTTGWTIHSNNSKKGLLFSRTLSTRWKSALGRCRTKYGRRATKTISFETTSSGLRRGRRRKSGLFNRPRGGQRQAGSQTSEGSFLAVSTPIFARKIFKYSFELRIFGKRDREEGDRDEKIRQGL